MKEANSNYTLPPPFKITATAWMKETSSGKFLSAINKQVWIDTYSVKHWRNIFIMRVFVKAHRHSGPYREL